jgi:Tol biopolymer transport system component
MKFHRRIIILIASLLAVFLLYGLGQAAQSTSSQIYTHLPLIFKDFSNSVDQIAFIGADPNNFSNQYIYLINADGSEQKNLTIDPAIIYNLVWSFDGSKIAFSAYSGGNNDIYVMNADGSGLFNLTNNPAQDHHPSWSPDGAQITFISDRQGSAQVYVMGLDGSNVTRLTDLAPGCTKPNWAPNGNLIAFDLFGDTPDDEEIYVINSDGTSLMRLTNNAYYDTVEDWSPDGSKILFLSARASIGSEDVFIMNNDGTDPVRLSPYGTVTGARWSPDGSIIAYYSYNFPLSVILSDGSYYTTLHCGFESIEAVDASWSLDGNRLAFSPISGSYLDQGIYVVRTDNTSCNRLTTMQAWGSQWRP